MQEVRNKLTNVISDAMLAKTRSNFDSTALGNTLEMVENLLEITLLFLL